MRKITRREFLKTASLAAAGIASPSFHLDERKATVAFGGDTLLGGYYSPFSGNMLELRDKIDKLKAEGGLEKVANTLFANVSPIFNNADYAVVNLEGPIVEGKTDAEISKKVVRKLWPLIQHPDTAEILKLAGIDMVSLANNHAFDYNGQEGLISTIEAIDAVGGKTEEFDKKLNYVGAGTMNMAFACKGVKIRGINIGFMGLTDVMEPDWMYATADRIGVAGIPEKEDYAKSLFLDFALKNIQHARKFADFVVVMLHAGPNSGNNVNEAQKEIADILIANSADVVVGMHSHSKQAIKEYRKGKDLKQVVFYGIGNLVFGGRKASQSISTIPVVEFYKDLIGNKKIAYKTYDIDPNPDGSFIPKLI